MTIVKAWFLTGIIPQIKSPVDRFNLSVYGAMGCNRQLIIRVEENFDADFFKTFIIEICHPNKS